GSIRQLEARCHGRWAIAGKEKLIILRAKVKGCDLREWRVSPIPNGSECVRIVDFPDSECTAIIGCCYCFRRWVYGHSGDRTVVRSDT
ncbi:MAG: hypothetical protein ACK5YO_05355, partial [Planctomyces sp.]